MRSARLSVSGQQGAYGPVRAAAGRRETGDGPGPDRGGGLVDHPSRQALDGTQFDGFTEFRLLVCGRAQTGGHSTIHMATPPATLPPTTVLVWRGARARVLAAGGAGNPQHGEEFR